jgi:hypothetical protein
MKGKEIGRSGHRVIGTSDHLKQNSGMDALSVPISLRFTRPVRLMAFPIPRDFDV